MDKRQIIFSTSILLTTLLASCWGQGGKQQHNDQQKKVDEFYTTTGGWDWIRVPLIKPYEVKKADPKEETSNWNVDFKNSLGTYNVRKVDVQDSIIYILSGRIAEKDDSNIVTLVNNKNVPTGWYIISVRQKIEKGFANETEFNQYISEHKYSTPQWHDIDSLSDALGNGGKVPWIPK